MRDAAGPGRRHQRPADHQPAGRTSTSTATRPPRWASRRRQIENALYNAYGSRQVSTIYTPTNQYWVVMELEPQYQTRSVGAVAAVRALEQRHAGAAQRGRDAARATVGPLAVNHLGPAAGGHDLVQPAARRRRSARRSTRSSGRRATCGLPATITSTFQGTAQAFQSSLQRHGHAAGAGDPRDLPRARHPLRELHPPAHDSVRPALRRLRRAAHAAALRQRAEHLRASSASSC